MVVVQSNIGRLIEVRLVSPVTLEDVAALGAALKKEMDRALRRQSQTRAVVVTDLRALALLSPPLFTALTELMRSNNALCERSAQLVLPTAVGGLQVDRAVREVNHTGRRNFDAVPQLLAYVGEVLTPAELQRAADFLAEPVPTKR